LNLLDLFTSLDTGAITTVAGVGYTEGIEAAEADIGWPMGVVRRPDGDLVFADIRGHRIWRIDREGILHTFAGDGVPGNSGDGGPALEGRLYTPHDFCLDSEGNLFFSQLGARGPDEGPNTIRRIDYRTGILTTVVGNGRMGRGGEGLHALEAEFDTTTGIAVDVAGNLYVCGKWDSNVRRVDAQTGMVSLFAGQTTRHYPGERGTSRPYSGSAYSFGGFHGDGGPASQAALYHPEHLAFDSAGNLYVCDNGSHRVRAIDRTSGIINTVFGDGQAASSGDGGLAVEASSHAPDALFIDGPGNLYVGEAGGYKVRKVDGRTGMVSTLAGTGVPGFGQEGLPGPQTRCSAVESGIWVDDDGTVFYSDSTGHLRRIDADTGIVNTVAGGTSIHDGGPADRAYLSCPRALCVGPDGHIYFCDMVHDRIRAIDPATGIIRTVAGNGGRAYGGDGGPATSAFLLNPYGLCVDRHGRIIIADTLNNRIRRIDDRGIIETIAGTGVASDQGDGGPARNAPVNTPHTVACHPGGDLYVGDASGRIRVIDQSERIRTVVGSGRQGWSGDHGPAVDARIGTPSSICFDPACNLYFADLTQHVIRKVDTNGIITTVAGSGEKGFSSDGTPAPEARLHRPFGVVVSRSGTIYFSDARNNRVRRIAPGGSLQTIAGGDDGGDRGDGGPAIRARLNEPHGLCLYGDSILLISDHYNNRIKAVKLDAA
jgi:sugar lactone lactonase YvrE